MAWTAPETVGAGQMIDAAFLNINLRDNVNALANHLHDGTGGGGSDALDGVDSITHDDNTDPAAPGADKLVVWTNSGKLRYRSGVSGAIIEIESDAHTH